MYIPFPAIY